MTDLINDVPSDDDGLWLSISDVAREKSVDKSVISRKVAELEKEGLIAVRPGPNKTKLVNLAQFDAAVGETTDLAKEQAAATRREADWGDGRLREAQIKRTQYEAALKSIELKRAVGNLVEIDRIQDVIAQVGAEIRKPLDQVPLKADELAAVAASGGASAVRIKLKEIIFGVCTEIAEALRKLDIRPAGGGA